jgi:hypothetical protein
MPNQETLTPFDPTAEGLYDRYVRGDYIDHAAWLRACAAGELVGTCRWCGDQLAPRPAEEVSKIWWYEADCRTCTKIYAAPGGRILKRSSRHTEQPAQWRTERNKRLKDQRKGGA